MIENVSSNVKSVNCCCIIVIAVGKEVFREYTKARLAVICRPGKEDGYDFLSKKQSNAMQRGGSGRGTLLCDSGSTPLMSIIARGWRGREYLQ